MLGHERCKGYSIADEHSSDGQPLIVLNRQVAVPVDIMQDKIILWRKGCADPVVPKSEAIWGGYDPVTDISIGDAFDEEHKALVILNQRISMRLEEMLAIIMMYRQRAAGHQVTLAAYLMGYVDD